MFRFYVSKPVKFGKIRIGNLFVLHFVKQVLDLHFTLCYLVDVYFKEGGIFMANLAYVRVSTIEQNDARQKEALAKYNIDKWFEEKVSGKDTNREKLQAMLEYCREGDTIYVHDFSRLARSTKDLLEIVELLQKKGVHLVSNKENLNTSTPSGVLMLTMIGAIAQFERENILERQREGIAIAKREGKYRGGQVKKIDRDLFEKLNSEYAERRINKRQFAEQLGVSRPTLDRLLREKMVVKKVEAKRVRS